MRPPHLAHSWASSNALNSAVWPAGAASTGTAVSAGLPSSALYDAASRARTSATGSRSLLLVRRQELLPHPAEDVVDDALRGSDVRVVRHPARLEARLCRLEYRGRGLGCPRRVRRVLSDM